LSDLVSVWTYIYIYIYIYIYMYVKLGDLNTCYPWAWLSFYEGD